MAPVVANAGILDRVSSVFNNSNSKQIEREEKQGVKCQSSVVAADRPALVPNYGAPTEELVPVSRSEELVPVSRSEDGWCIRRSIDRPSHCTLKFEDNEDFQAYVTSEFE